MWKRKSIPEEPEPIPDDVIKEVFDRMQPLLENLINEKVKQHTNALAEKLVHDVGKLFAAMDKEIKSLKSDVEEVKEVSGLSMDKVIRHDEHRGIDLWENILWIVDTIKAGELKGFIRVTLMNDNLEDLKKIHSLGVPVLAMPIRKRPDRAPSREQVLEAMKYATLPTNCPVGRGQFVITPELRCLDCIFARNYVCSLNPLDSESFRHMLRKYGQLQPYPCGEPYWWSQ